MKPPATVLLWKSAIKSSPYILYIHGISVFVITVVSLNISYINWLKKKLKELYKVSQSPNCNTLQKTVLRKKKKQCSFWHLRPSIAKINKLSFKKSLMAHTMTSKTRWPRKLFFYLKKEETLTFVFVV